MSNSKLDWVVGRVGLAMLLVAAVLVPGGGVVGSGCADDDGNYGACVTDYRIEFY